MKRQKDEASLLTPLNLWPASGGSSCSKDSQREILWALKNAPHTRKSLVKGERFVRSVWRAQALAHICPGWISYTSGDHHAQQRLITYGGGWRRHWAILNCCSFKNVHLTLKGEIFVLTWATCKWTGCQCCHLVYNRVSYQPRSSIGCLWQKYRHNSVTVKAPNFGNGLNFGRGFQLTFVTKF